jgi:hypothetical protein
VQSLGKIRLRSGPPVLAQIGSPLFSEAPLFSIEKGGELIVRAEVVCCVGDELGWGLTGFSTQFLEGILEGEI